jgi:hypothetical protein
MAEEPMREVDRLVPFNQELVPCAVGGGCRHRFVGDDFIRAFQNAFWTSSPLGRNQLSRKFWAMRVLAVGLDADFGAALQLDFPAHSLIVNSQ